MQNIGLEQLQLLNRGIIEDLKNIKNSQPENLLCDAVARLALILDVMIESEIP